MLPLNRKATIYHQQERPSMLKINMPLTILLLLACFIVTPAFASESIDDIVNEIQKLEDKRDPKCYATASRLEDFMFGTPLSHEARFRKNLLQKSWAKQQWEKASEIARAQGDTAISPAQLQAVIFENLRYQQGVNQHWEVAFSGGQALRINREDKRQYSTIAYALRAILAVQQASLMSLDSDLLPLQAEAIPLLKNSLDLLSLSVLKIADARARKENQHEVNVDSLNDIWTTLATIEPNQPAKNLATAPNQNLPADLSLVKKIINQKIDSYQAYNQASSQLFVRNLQVYYARLSWPKKQEEGNVIKNLFTETMIGFAHQLYQGAEAIALKHQHTFILESDVHELIQQLIPHTINEYEDALFFPKLAANQRVSIESYDMDSFRDSGGHWRYLDYAIRDPSFSATLQPDPFALELIVENIAQFGVLSLRVAGEVGKQQDASHLSAQFYADGLVVIQKRISEHAIVQENSNQKTSIVSSTPSTNDDPDTQQNMFSDVTTQWGINSEHRSSDLFK